MYSDGETSERNELRLLQKLISATYNISVGPPESVNSLVRHAICTAVYC